jgi:hypothetical protein
MINAKQSHKQKQNPANNVPEKRNKKPQAPETYDTDRIGCESDDTLCGFSGIAQVPVVDFERQLDTVSTVQNVVPLKMRCSRSQEDVYSWKT